jgi:hypothetical protein
MNQQLEIKKRSFLTTAKVGIFFWMLAVIFVYLLLFGSPEFWFITERLGLSKIFQVWRDWLAPFFNAGYLE